MTNQDLSLIFPGSSMFALSITSRTRRPSSKATRRWRLFNPEVRKRSPIQGHKPLEGWTYKNRVPWQMKRLKPCTNEKEEFSTYNYNFFYDFCCTIFNILLIGNKYAKVKISQPFLNGLSWNFAWLLLRWKGSSWYPSASTAVFHAVLQNLLYLISH